MMEFPVDRASGILLHITSLPSAWGIGDLGPRAYQFIDFLVESGQQLWQVLPLGPTGWGNSPYMCFSAFAGNPLLISPESLQGAGWLQPTDWEGLPEWPVIQGSDPTQVKFERVIPFKTALLQQAWTRFQLSASDTDHQGFEQFCQDQAHWLEDYSLFAALKIAHQGQAWMSWPQELALRDPQALQQARQDQAGIIKQQQFFQFLFELQWQGLRTYAQEQGIRLIGDLPIYVAQDSADVWSHRDLFQLDGAGYPLAVAGVPPDYFSATGQLWGNPLYQWHRMKETGYHWYLQRLQWELQRFDRVRIDHFRGFAQYYSIPSQSQTAEAGQWVDGPGADLFEAAQNRLGELRIIAEDLGIITEDVTELRDRFGLKGMKVIQFGFDTPAVRNMLPHLPDAEILSPHNPFLPCNYEANYVVYTGTHDNNTVVGWFNGNGFSPQDRQALLDYLGRQLSDYEGDHQVHWDLIRLAFSTVASWAIVPLQDVLGLGAETRMNLPGSSTGNWNWRFTAEQLSPDLAQRLAHLTHLYARGRS